MIARMRALPAALATTAALALVGPGTAAAIIIAPPGKAGANQYFETIPSSDGNAAPPGSSGATPAGGGSLAGLGRGRAGAAGLSKLGKDGHAAAALAAATAPGHPRGGSGTNGAPGTNGATSSGGAGSLPAGRGDSSPGAILDALTGSDSGGLGAILPIVMVAALLVFAAALLAKRRAGGVNERSGESA
jgi:hypothetical protein